jgi:hypothetical protein
LKRYGILVLENAGIYCRFLSYDLKTVLPENCISLKLSVLKTVFLKKLPY